MLGFLGTSPMSRRAAIGLAAAAVVSWASAAIGVASAQEPRAYELVSPAAKNGGDIMPFSPRTRAASDGDAVGFASLIGFGDARGTGVAVEYLAQRRPELGRWATHALTPTVPTGSLNSRAGLGDTNFEGEFSPDFKRGLLASVGRVPGVSGDGNVRDVANLYRRDDLRTPGAGSYELLSRCPACDATSTPLAPISGSPSTLQFYLPRLAGASADMEHVAFESIQVLTSDTPPQTPICGPDNVFFPPPSPYFCAPHLYEWDHGQVRLAGILPDGTPADASFAGTGARAFTYTPHVVSDGKDGHSRIIFTQPTDGSGLTFSQSDLFGQFQMAFAQSGNLFVRVDHAQTVQLNESERTNADAFTPAQYLEASADGTRIFFMTNQALTNDSQPGGRKVYMYDATKPASAPDNLTLVSSTISDVSGMLGVSDDGHYAYFMGDDRIFMWHDGAMQDIGQGPLALVNELPTDGVQYGQTLRQARVSPNGRHLIFTSDRSPVPDSFDHGPCNNGFGCRTVYVYSADTNQVVCVSCSPSGAATVDAEVVAEEFHGAAASTSYQNRGITDNGHAFFSTADPLVSEDTNGRSDAYEYDVNSGALSLISSGKDPSDSFYVDASSDGRNVFFATRERLVGWDRDTAYDLYDARVGGGFPEPPPAPPVCSGGTCQGTPARAPAFSSSGSAAFHGPGNVKHALRPRARRAHRGCRPGQVKRTVRGRRKCVKRKAHRARGNRSGS